MTYGKPGMIHGFKCYVLQDEKGEPSPVYSVASGLDYPGVGPEHSMLHDLKRVTYTSIERRGEHRRLLPAQPGRKASYPPWRARTRWPSR